MKRRPGQAPNPEHRKGPASTGPQAPQGLHFDQTPNTTSAPLRPGPERHKGPLQPNPEPHKDSTPERGGPDGSFRPPRGDLRASPPTPPRHPPRTP
jgi:hypothetical protein